MEFRPLNQAPLNPPRGARRDGRARSAAFSAPVFPAIPPQRNAIIRRISGIYIGYADARAALAPRDLAALNAPFPPPARYYYAAFITRDPLDHVV